MTEDVIDGTASHPAASGEAGAAPAVSLWERIVAGLGALLVVAAVGYLGWYALGHRSSPPQLSAETLSIAPAGTGFLVAFQIRNSGDTTAEDLQVEGALREGGRTVERSLARIQFVPSHSTREGGLLFSRDPRGYELVIRPMGYSKP